MSEPKFKVGDIVERKIFGIGKVIAIAYKPFLSYLVYFPDTHEHGWQALWFEEHELKKACGLDIIPKISPGELLSRVYDREHSNVKPTLCFSDGADIEERYAESVKDEVPDEEVPKELHPAVEKFKKLLDDTMVNHPPHYTAGKVECIDALEAATTGLQGIEAVCTANAIKYLWRWKHKNGVQDLKKAIFYINYLINWLEKEGDDIESK